MALFGFVTEPATTTPMYDGMPLAGGGLSPPVVVKLTPQTLAGVVLGSVETLPAKPLKAIGAVPPVRLFTLDQESLHHVTVEDPAPVTVLSPSTKAPRLGKANTIAVVLSLAAW
jgi:hypothetical protein